MSVLSNGVCVLKRIADLGNWLTYDESSAVRDEYNAVVSVFLCLERTLWYNFGSDAINGVERSACSEKKSVLDFVKWHKDGYDLAHDLMLFLKDGGNDLKYRGDDKEVVRGGWDKIRKLCDAVLHMDVTVRKEDW